MAKNRKNGSVAIRFGPAIKALLGCVLFVVCAVGYVWQKSVILDLQRQSTMGKQALKTLQNRNRQLRDQLAGLTSPEQLKERMRELSPGLALPTARQVWRPVEPPAPPSARPAPAAQRYAARL